MKIPERAIEQAKYRLGNLWDQKIDADTETCRVITKNNTKDVFHQFSMDVEYMLELDPSLKLPCVNADSIPSQTAITGGEVNVYQFCKQRSSGDLNTGMFNHNWLYKAETPRSASFVRLVTPGNRSSELDWNPYKTPFEKKSPVVFWRGSVTGCLNDYEIQNLRKLEYTEEQIKILGKRSHFVEYFHDHPHSSVDIGVYDGNKGRIVSKTEFEEYIKLAYGKYKYMLYLEGNDIGSNVWWTYMPNCVVLRPSVVRCNCVYDLYLRPWKHYVPIDPIHPEDIIDKIDWCEKNTNKCLDIINNANFAHELVINSELRHETYKIMARKIKDNLII